MPPYSLRQREDVLLLPRENLRDVFARLPCWLVLLAPLSADRLIGGVLARLFLPVRGFCGLTRGAGVHPLPQEGAGLVALFPGFRQADSRELTECEPFFLAPKTKLQPPQRAPGGGDFHVQTVGVVQAVRFLSSLGVLDFRGGQGGAWRHASVGACLRGGAGGLALRRPGTLLRICPGCQRMQKDGLTPCWKRKCLIF